MCAFVICYGLAERARQVITVLAPNIVSVRAIHDHWLPELCTFSVPFDHDEGAVISHSMDFFNVFVYYTYSAPSCSLKP
jgi:hypothetical protein